MNEPAPSLPLRQAALLAHGMPAPDREWLLGRLEPVQRGVLDGLLRELQALHIPPDHDLLEVVLRDHRPAPVRTAEDRLAHLDAQGVAHLVALLRSEPRSLRIRLLRLREWPWRDQVAAALEAASQRIEPGGEVVPQPATALDAALLDALCAALAGSAGGFPPVPASGRWTEIFRRKAWR